MTTRTATRLSRGLHGRRRAVAAWSLAALGPSGLLLSQLIVLASGRSFNGGLAIFVPAFVGAVAMSLVGAMIATRTDNPIGWIFLAIPATTGISQVAQSWYEMGAASGRGYAAIAYWFSQWPFFASLMLFVAIFYLFPTGRLPSHRWRWPWRIYLASGAVTVLGFMVLPYEVRDAGGLVTNPVGIEPIAGVLSVLLAVSGITALVSAFCAFVSLGVRYRGAGPEERQQIRWLFAVGAVGAFLLVVLIATALLTHDANTGPWARFADVVMLILVTDVVVGIPVATGIAIFRYRLYDLDVVVSKAIVAGMLAVFTTAVYVAIVVVLGRAIGAQQGSIVLSVAATAVVAVVFQPLREGAGRVANRIVYGHRATPYEVLARFSDRVGDAYATEDVLPRTARVLAEGVRAEGATVWLHLGDRFVPAATWPEPGEAEVAEPGTRSELADIPGDHVAPVRYLEETLGALAVVKPRGDPLTPDDAKLLDDLAGQAGLVLANVRMTADLEARLAGIERQAEELKASRQRIVAAQDAERRRLERNIHDGAQQHLVAMSVRLRLIRGLVAKDPVRARGMLEELRGQIDEALETLHGLALGIYPPVLEAQGLAAAVGVQAARSPIPVEVRTNDLGRQAIELEAAAYFCVLEALQNAAKYAQASRILVTLSDEDGALAFEVRDDGVGFDPTASGGGTGLAGMRDRLAVLGGDVELISAPGAGTTVRGAVPIGSAVTVAGIAGTAGAST